MELLTEILQANNDCLEIKVFYVFNKSKKKTIWPKIKSLNEFISKASRANPWAYKSYSTLWAKALRSIPKITRVEKKAYVTIVSIRSRLLDKINLYGGAKPVEDILVAKGWIKDDNPKWCELSVMQGKGKPEYTYIKIQYL